MSRGCFIDGAWRPGTGVPLTSIDPSTGQPVWQGQGASRNTLREAVVKADLAFASWSRAPQPERERIVRAFGAQLEAHKAELADAICRETGKPRWEAATEVASMIGKVDISIRMQHERAGEKRNAAADHAQVLRHRPHGVLAVLGPYNFPGHLPNGHIVPALLAGNTVVFKPSELTPLVAEKTVELWQAAGLPAGVLNLVQGGREVGEYLVADDEIDGYLFTGSAHVGHLLHARLAQRPDKILALEMGGNNPLVAWDWGDGDGDELAAALLIVQSAYATAGQRCTCARRLVIPGDHRGEALLARVAVLAGGLRVGRPDDQPAPYMGPVISAAAADKLLAAQSALLAAGARAVLPMQRLGLGPAFLSPGLVEVTGVRDLADEEHFGPLLLVQRAGTFDEALQVAGRTRFGLAAGLISRERTHWERFLTDVRAGVMNWNRPLPGASSAAPFGGVGASGNHRPSAAYAADYCAYPVASLESEALVAPAPDKLPPGLVP